MATLPLNLLVWNENIHETRDENVIRIYPDGIHRVIADALQQQLSDSEVRTATLADPEHGLTEAALADTDVLLWWGHEAHDAVDDAVVQRVKTHVLGGMGLIVLHSGHWSKIFTSLLGTTATLRWRSSGDRELVWTATPSHPIAHGVPNPIVIAEQEMYGEPFDIPTPDETIFMSSFSGGEVFRSGVTFTRGRGRIFYFSPGDQEYPVYHHPDIQRVIANGVEWAAPRSRTRDIPRLDGPVRPV
jgi:trehalose utilization protein